VPAPVAIARRYAEAYFDLAREAGDIDGWGRDLARAAEILSDPQVFPVLRNPRLTAAERVSIALDVLQDVAEPTRNLARVLVERGRAELLPAVSEQYRRLADRASGVVRAEVTTAVEVDERTERQIARALEERLGASVKTEVRTDPSILGGMVVRIGDRVIDDSVRTHLQQLQASLA
jgi:F-type H+-transporting ATPase subunit delta